MAIILVSLTVQGITVQRRIALSMGEIPLIKKELDWVIYQIK